MIEVSVEQLGRLQVTCGDCGAVETFSVFESAWQWAYEHPCSADRVPPPPGHQPPG